MEKEIYKGMEYLRPKAYILADNGIAHSEFAARTCYDSFDSSEHEVIKTMNKVIQNNELYNGDMDDKEWSKVIAAFSWQAFVNHT